MTPALPTRTESISPQTHTSRLAKPSVVLASLIFLTIVVTGYRINSPLLVNPDEPRYAEVAREMTESNDWITPRFNYTEFLEKPVLFYWLVAYSYKLFGISEFSARLPSVLASTGTIVLVFLFGVHLWNLQTGFVSALLLLTCAEYVMFSRAAVIDMTLTVFLTLAIYGEYLLLHPRSFGRGTQWGSNRTRTCGVFLFFIGMGLAMLTKGPIGVLFPVCIGVLYVILTRQTILLKSVSRSAMVFGALLFCLITVPWYAAIIGEVGFRFIDEFVLGHNIERFLTSKYGHSGSFFYYLPVVLAGAFPWSVHLPCMASQLLYTGLKQQKMPIETKQKFVFLGVWFSFIFLFFSFSYSKIATYILPLFPALSLMLGYYWVQIIDAPTAPRFKRVGLIWFTGLLFILSTAFILTIAISIWSGTPEMVVKYTGTRVPGGLLLGLIPVGYLLATWFAWLNRPRSTYASVVTTTILGVIILLHVVVPIYVELHQIPNRHARWVRKEISSTTDLISYRYFKHGFVFYTRHRIDRLDSEQELDTRLVGGANSHRPFVGFTRQTHWDELPREKRAGLSILLQERDFIVFTNSSRLVDRQPNPVVPGQ